MFIVPPDLIRVPAVHRVHSGMTDQVRQDEKRVEIMTDKPTRDQWAAAADKEVKGKDLTWATPEGIDVKPLYTAEDVADIDPGLPGFAPFTRGVRASMYAGRPWTIRQIGRASCRARACQYV